LAIRRFLPSRLKLSWFALFVVGWVAVGYLSFFAFLFIPHSA
jgi:hypothetical protein